MYIFETIPVLVLQCANSYLLLVVVASHPQRAASVISNATQVGERKEVRGWIPVLLGLMEIDDTQVIVEALEILRTILQVKVVWRRWRGTDMCMHVVVCVQTDCAEWSFEVRGRILGALLV